MVTVRTAGIDDYPAIVWLRRQWADERFGPADDPEFDAAALTWLAEQSAQRTCFVAESDGEVVGFVTMLVAERMPLPGKDGGRWGYINHLYVSATHRRGGIAQELVAATIGFGREQRYERILVHPNEQSADLFAASGFGAADDLRVLPLAST